MVIQCVKHFAGIRDNTAHTTEMGHRHAAFRREAHVLYHLPGVEFYREHAFHLAGKPRYLGFRERHSVMGRSSPTFTPCARASSMALRQIRATEPNATIR